MNKRGSISIIVVSEPGNRCYASVSNSAHLLSQSCFHFIGSIGHLLNLFIDIGHLYNLFIDMGQH